MIQIRNNVFETNSSMTHCLVMCDKTKYDKWAAGEMMFKMNGHQFTDNASARKFNAYHLRKNLKIWQEYGRYIDDPVLNEDTIQKYENGEYKDNHWGLFARWDIDDYFITFEQWNDYIDSIGMEEIRDTSKILVDDKLVDIIGFGYYGHD